MSATGKMLVITGLIRSIYERWRLQRLVPGMIAVAWLVIMTAMLANALLMGGFYAGYHALLYYGMDSQSAVFIVLLLLAAIMVLCVFLALTCLRHMRDISGKLWRQSTSPARAREAIDAFLQGFMTENKR